MPLYNAAATLAACLDSIRCQTYAGFELVAVDDGSEDTTLALLADNAARDARIKLVRLPYHQGIVAALNQGLTHCRGDFIARMDADDRMLPQRLQRQLAYITQHSELDLVGSQFQVIKEASQPSAAQIRYQDWSNSLLSDSAIKQAIFIESPIAHPTFFAKRALLTDLNGYREQPWAEDYDFLLRAYQHGAVFGKVPQVLLEKRDSATRLYRTDPRCKRPALLAAKAHFFAQGTWLTNGRALYITGSGPSGRTVAQALIQENLSVSGFIDNINTPSARTVMGLPAWHRASHAVERLLNQSPRPFFLLCIGDAEGRAEQEAQLQMAGLALGRDYLRFV